MISNTLNKWWKNLVDIRKWEKDDYWVEIY